MVHVFLPLHSPIQLTWTLKRCLRSHATKAREGKVSCARAHPPTLSRQTEKTEELRVPTPPHPLPKTHCSPPLHSALKPQQRGSFSESGTSPGDNITTKVGKGGTIGNSSLGGGGGDVTCHIQHSPGTPTIGLRERGNDTSKSTGRSGRQNAATRRNMRREERVTVQAPVKKQQPDGMSHRTDVHATPAVAARVYTRTHGRSQVHHAEEGRPQGRRNEG